MPPLLGTSDLLAFTVSDEIKVAHHDYQATRKLNRNSEGVFMAVNSDVSVVTSVFCQWRVLLTYA